MSSYSDALTNNMCGYGSFSEFYDTLTDDVDYKGRADYLYGLFSRFGAVPTLMLDVACGTGSFSNEFAEKGIEVIGADPSDSMLSVAREKALQRGNDILFLCQSAQELELYGTVDGVICCLDSINHITDPNELAAAFSRISLFLEPGKLFIFDVNTEYKHQEVLADETFVIENDSVFCVWQNSYDDNEKLTTVYLDFFKQCGDKYERFSEDFAERAYTDTELRELLSKAGLKVEAVYGDMTTLPPKSDSQRNVYVTRKA